ncbi:sensor histidine kinase [Candidatus Contubernalis alkaliaceticus]|uniref:sensor histidine kinase n=1 Tax=Candidatus Contubernalis alkaliaceticus TaxID=338645 RepID=UPI001F4C2B08|nr:sensor histidine kinase [Candidatus Contubernalis alkalaceticus]UNC92034.1 sensor histidine kinase [Candidatus Contubernalis alkalaceticus]
MNRKLPGEFLKDHISLTIFYYVAVSLLILYFTLEIDEGIDLFYPLALATLVYLVFISIKAVNYLRFANLLFSLRTGAFGHSMSNAGLSSQQKITVATINEITKTALNRQHQLQLQNQEKQRVISHIVHNIKTPAAVIDLAVQNCKEGEDATRALEQIQQENRNINDNLDQVLNYLRLDKFQHDYLIERVDLVCQLREKINQKKDSFIYNNVFPKMSVTGELYVLTDRKWNGIILDQVISNAIKYTAVKEEDGIISFRIFAAAEKVNLEIEDNGIGIFQFDLKRVFEQFFTGKNGRQVKTASGIGLYICKKIADELNHQIKITSEVGIGTKVVITYLTKT